MKNRKEKNKKIRKTLWPLFMDRVSLQRDSVLLTTKSPERLRQPWNYSVVLNPDSRAPFYEYGLIVSRLQSYYEETVLFLPRNPEKFLVIV